MCHHHGPHRKQTSPPQIPDISQETLINAQAAIRATQKIQLIGGGEPLLAKNIIQKLTYLHDLNPAANIELYSNGSLLDNPEFIQNVLKNLKTLHISVNGTQSYDAIMLGGSFGAIQQNMQMISRINKTLSSPVALYADFVIMRSNYMDLISFVQFVKESGFKGICIKDLWVGSDVLKKESIKHDQELLVHAAKKIQETVAYGRAIGMEVFCDSSLELSINLVKESTAPKATVQEIKNKNTPTPPPNVEKKNVEIKAPTCTQAWEVARIETNGDVILCCNGVNRIGSLLENDFESIWQGAEAQEYRKGLVTQQYYKGCTKCKLVKPLDPASYEV
jgi:radical SAM protein with 4Fe4S-binding SPASM domain